MFPKRAVVADSNNNFILLSHVLDMGGKKMTHIDESRKSEPTQYFKWGPRVYP